MRTLFRTSTAILTSLSLAAPVPGFAQAPTQQVPTCADGSVPPCPNREEAKTPDQRAAEERAKLRQAEREAQRKADREAQRKAERDAAAQAERDAAAQAERDAAAQRDAAMKADREAAAQAEREAAAQADAAARAEREAAAQAERDAAARRDRPVANPEARQPQQPTGGTTEAVPTGEANTQRPRPRRDGTVPGGTTARDPDRPSIAAPETPTPEERSRRQERREARAAERAPEPVAATGGTTEATDVAESIVTEDEVRRSNEDYETRADAQVASDRKSGLSDLEKALLIGAGALVVGGLIRNSNKRVVSNSGDRVVVEDDGSFEVIKDDNALLRQPGSDVRTETFSDGSSRQTITRPDGSKIVTIRDPELRVLRRVRVAPDGTQVVLFDDTTGFRPVDVSTLPPPAPRPSVSTSQDGDAALRAALAAENRAGRAFTLSQIRGIERVRELVPPITLDNVTFATGSAAITPDQARALSDLGRLMADEIAANPREVFLIEGHTDAVGAEPYNLALSDRRAETVALALTEYFDVPPENMIVQGYGEAYLKVPTEAAERANRRVTVRRITPLLHQVAAN
jgi:outer membrane protein OmpA-like peptidoglycan-associated protein